MTDPKEPGQVAHETFFDSADIPYAWGVCHPRERKRWAAVEQAVREQCAQIADKIAVEEPPLGIGSGEAGWWHALERVAVAIRESTHD